MKKGATLLILTALLGTLLSYSSIGQANSENTTVLLYNQFALIEVEKTVDLKAGYNEVPLKMGYPGDVTVLINGANFLGLSKDIEGYALGIPIGSTVTIMLKDRTQISGKILGYRNNLLVVKRGEQETLVNPNEILYVAITKEPEDSRKLKIYAESPGKYNLTLITKIDGIKWNVEYILILKEDEFTLQGTAKISNPTPLNLKGRVYLVTGDVSGREVPIKTEISGTGSYEKREHVTVFSLGTLEIRGRSENAVKFLEETNKWEKVYLYESLPYREEGPVYEVIRFKTYVPLPPGTVKVFKKDYDKLVLLSEANIEEKARGDTVEIILGREYELKGETRVLQVTKIGDKTKYKVEITIENLGEEPREIIIRHYKTGLVTYSSVKPIEETANYVIMKIKVGPREKKSVIIEYET
ncbi:hypothetical protein PNA2_0344 [Pyrococcus sp. NA2]|uniref:hypothetical protein n=1 Tax=Pyrococcus sp. (strain NA2) TaxID=342949 RepID=UPI000209A906|nr:hypothetical protein [Pyrococcus sp. NA2]AEC51260.1 hypothetical protein PNA2_0344 [Pyrococcus sp. NA2]